MSFVQDFLKFKRETRTMMNIVVQAYKVFGKSHMELQQRVKELEKKVEEMKKND